MKLEILAKKGVDGEVAFAIKPANGFTLIKKAKSKTELFPASTAFTKVATVPAQVHFVCMFDFRPWSIAVAAHAGDQTGSASLTSDALGLPPKTLIKPDVLTIDVIFSESGGPSALVV